MIVPSGVLSISAAAPKGYIQTAIVLPLIAEIKPEVVLDVAEELIDHPDPTTRSLAMSAVRPFTKDKRTIDLWIKATSDADQEIRMDAARYLGESPRAHALTATSALMTLRSDPEREVRRKAVQSLRRLTGGKGVSDRRH